MQGQEIGSYILESPLGRGGMGEVFLARHKSLGTRAAVKVLSVAVDEPQFHERFSREARAQASLSHPNVARVLDHVHKDGRWYLITEYMSRGTLRDAMKKAPGPVPVEKALAWTRQALRGLDYAHRQGIVHRDVKPGNILLNEQGEAAVTDFGLAKVVGGQSLTRTGTALGTPAYMSPEQLSGDREVDHRTDLYSMGVVLYELLTGRVPFPMETASEVVRILVNEPPPLREVNPDLAPELEDLVMRALVKDPEARYADCAEFAAAVDTFERGMDSVAVQQNPAVAAVTPPPLPPPPPPPPPPLEALAAADRTFVEPTAVVAPEAQMTPPPVHRERTVGLVAAVVVAVVVLGGLAAGAAYFLWPKAPDPTPDPPVTADDRTAPGGPDVATGLVAVGSLNDGSEATPEDPRQDAMAGTEQDGRLRVEDDSVVAGARLASASPSSDPSDADSRTRGARPRFEDVRPEESSETSAPPVSPPPRYSLPPVEPTVAVIALGDPLFARGFESEVEGRLRGLGHEVADERSSLVLSDVLRRWGDEVSIPELVPLLEEAGFHAFVLIQVEHLGERELLYLGRQSWARQARIHLNAYLVADQGALGPGWSEAVEYTELNAASKAEAAMFGATDEMARAIDSGWRTMMGLPKSP